MNDKFIIDFMSNCDNHYLGNNKYINLKKYKEFELKDLALYHIEKITFEEKSSRKEALENVISSLRIDGINFVYLMMGDNKGVHFYFGVVKDLYNNKDLELDVKDIGKYVLEPSFRGNFKGSKISEVNDVNKNNIVEKINNMDNYSLMEGVPGINEEKEEFQGVDKLVDVMLGDEFGFMILSKPVDYLDITRIEKSLFETYTAIAPMSKIIIQKGNSIGIDISKIETQGDATTEGESYSKSDQKNKIENKGTRITYSKGGNSSKNDGNNWNKSEGENWDKSTSKGKSDTKGTSTSTNKSESVAEGGSILFSNSKHITREFINREAQEWMKYLDEAIIPRIDYGKGKGIFISSTFIFTNNKGSLIKLKNTIKSLYSGKRGNKVPLRDIALNKNGNILKPLKDFQIPFGNLNEDIETTTDFCLRAALSQYVNKNGELYLGNWISTNELSLLILG